MKAMLFVGSTQIQENWTGRCPNLWSSKGPKEFIWGGHHSWFTTNFCFALAIWSALFLFMNAMFSFQKNKPKIYLYHDMQLTPTLCLISLCWFNRCNLQGLFSFFFRMKSLKKWEKNPKKCPWLDVPWCTSAVCLG